MREGVHSQSMSEDRTQTGSISLGQEKARCIGDLGDGRTCSSQTQKSPFGVEGELAQIQQ